MDVPTLEYVQIQQYIGESDGLWAISELVDWTTISALLINWADCWMEQKIIPVLFHKHSHIVIELSTENPL